MANTKETELIRVEIKETELIIVVNCSSEVVWEELAVESLAVERQWGSCLRGKVDDMASRVDKTQMGHPGTIADLRVR